VDPAARTALLAWYRAHRRDLPWRRSRDPYAVWVSEAMLQQTRVEAAIPYFLRWMERFPTVQALAAAPEQEVLAAWAGLGYYRRARSLHAAARQVVAEHAGQVPASAAALAGLPGVGPYTAAAVASIAHGEPVACVDGNVVRVASRLLALRAAVGPRERRRIQQAAQAWLDPAHPGDWNQAMMELGATVCTPRPRCPACPVAAACRARALGIQEGLPRMPAKRPPRLERQAFALVRDGGRVLLVRRGAGLLGGMWGLPGGPAEVPAEEWVRRQAGIEVRPAGPAASATHRFTHVTWEMEVQPAVPAARPAPVPPAEGARWFDASELGGAAVPTAMRKAIAAAGTGGAEAP
jgi:A/G-specific adenine glycosylase